MERVSGKIVKAAQRLIYERSFYEFVKRAWQEIDAKPYIDNWHVKVICDHMQGLAEGSTDKRNLLINIAPGTAKSMICNTLFSAWLWTHSPQLRILSLSHKESLAVENSTKTRRLIQSDWYQSFWPIKLMTDQNSKGSFGNNHMGVRECSPMTTATGKRANFVIIDDPHTPDDAKSFAKRTSTLNTFREAIPSRINDPRRDSIIVVMQRLHVEDVSGFVLEHPELGYDHLCIPYFADGEDREPTEQGWVDPRPEGEPMFREHFGSGFLERQRAQLGPYAFEGQYQQNPVPSGAGFLDTEWFLRYRPEQLPRNILYYMTSDHAPSGTGDYNCFRIWAVDKDKHCWLVDSFYKKCLMDEALGVTKDEYGRTKLAEFGALPLIRKYSPICWFAENDNTFISIKGFIETAMIETGVMCLIKPQATKGSGDKEGKAMAYQALASMGLIHLPEGPIGDTALLEYKDFPVGKHDDQVDADGMIARVLNAGMGGAMAPVESVAEARPADYRAAPLREYNVSDSVWG